MEQSRIVEEKQNNHTLCMALLAHVDAGKTTLAEGLLYLCGQIRALGRVDHQDAFLDHFALERQRGITIFSKQANLTYKNLDITMLDTPGHVDFSAEMERTLQVLDVAVLVVSGKDGVQGHTRTLWQLLKKYHVPTFIFVNKMDMADTDREWLFSDLQKNLCRELVDFTSLYETGQLQLSEEFFESATLCSETLLEEYLETGELRLEQLQEEIENRNLFPVFFGSALKLTGVVQLLQGLADFTREKWYPEEFAARVFKITRDEAGNRLTHLKVTGGTLLPRQLIEKPGEDQGVYLWQEKVDQIRKYHGTGFTLMEKALPGDICVVTGLSQTYSGEGLGGEHERVNPVLEPIMTYQMILPKDRDPVLVLGQLRRLEEEDPQLSIEWKEEFKEIHVKVMGEIQLEILRSLMLDRFGLEVSFGEGSIVYKETLKSPVVGIGHFEPLRHYAEVHLYLEPGERGQGLTFETAVSEDLLDKNWQRLILTHLEEKLHKGVLTGSELTDVKITVIGGRAHNKHTEGGDFRQATYRAVRQGLMSGESVLLEPYFGFVLEVPTEYLGRAMTDLTRMQGRFTGPENKGDMSVLTGTVPVATMEGYQRILAGYTKGLGKLSLQLKGYDICHNEQEVLAASRYSPEADLRNTPDSVFCAHGAGFVVPWYQVPDYAHVSSQIPSREEEEKALQQFRERQQEAYVKRSNDEGYISTEEIDAIFKQSYHRNKDPEHMAKRYHKAKGSVTVTAGAGTRQTSRKPAVKKEKCLLVDGYNIIFAWPKLQELSRVNLDSARDALMDILCDYQGIFGGTLILVFDAYKVKGNLGSTNQYHNIYVVFTKEAETADQYIEKTVHEMANKFDITVATSDALEQMIIWGEGAMRLSALGLLETIEREKKEMWEQYEARKN